MSDNTYYSIFSVVAELQKFHGQDVYHGIGTSVAKRSARARFLMRLVRIAAPFWCFNLFFLIGAVLFLRYLRVPDRGDKVFQYGISHNNKIAFDKLNLCLPDDVRKKIVMNGRPPNLFELLKAVFSLRLMFLSSKILASNYHENPFVHVQAVIGVSACVFYSANPLPADFRILCVANDHAPVPLALMVLCRAKGLKTVYVQHAPVTAHFPALKSDLSILYDDRSVDAYRDAANKAGKPFDSSIVLMPPFEEGFVSPSSNYATSVVIGLCLSKFPDLEALSGLLFSLCDCPNVESIVLRPHPASRADLSAVLVESKVLLQREGMSLDEFSSGLSLVLVPTSGVAIELLHKGVPTFYTPGMDEIPDDYYGFVANGILPVFDVARFSDEGLDTSFFDAEWKARFSSYDVTVNKTLQECRREVGDAFIKLF